MQVAFAERGSHQLWSKKARLLPSGDARLGRETLGLFSLSHRRPRSPLSCTEAAVAKRASLREEKSTARARNECVSAWQGKLCWLSCLQPGLRSGVVRMRSWFEHRLFQVGQFFRTPNARFVAGTFGAAFAVWSCSQHVPEGYVALLEDKNENGKSISPDCFRQAL